MIGLDVDRTMNLDRSDMNILDNSFDAIQENYEEQRSIDSADAQIHNSENSREDSPDQFKSMIGGMNGKILDPRMTMDLGMLKQKQDSMIQNSNDINSILPTGNVDSSFNLPSIQKKAKKNKKMVMMSMALPKKGKYSLSKPKSIRNSKNSKNDKKRGSINSIKRRIDNSPDLQSPMRIVDEETELTDNKKMFNGSFDLSSQTIQKSKKAGNCNFLLIER